MPTRVLTDVAFFIAEFNFSAEMNEVSLTQDVEAPDATTFATGGTRTFVPGLAGVSAVHHGWYDTDTAINAARGPFFDDVGVQLAGLHTLMPEGGLEDEVAYMFEAMGSRYSVNGAIGDIFGFDLEYQPRGDLLRGRTMLDSEVSLVSTKVGVALNLGPTDLGGGEIINAYSGIHCTAFDGTTLDVIVESDDANGFPSTTTRISHTQLTGVGSELLAFTAGTLDDWWRITGTFVGTSFTLAAVVAIQA